MRGIQVYLSKYHQGLRKINKMEKKIENFTDAFVAVEEQINKLVNLINTHTVLIKQNQEDIDYWKKAHVALQAQHIKLQDKVKQN